MGLFNGKLCSMCKMIVGWEIGQVALMDLRNGKTCSIFQIIVDNQAWADPATFSRDNNDKIHCFKLVFEFANDC